ncbi:Nitrogen permease regulator 2 [Nowakowskiella sp. JEL0407]|nr:Nitrogen permease regulator 2 [Nowakowskiella sp. JEL0407]
MNIQFPPLSALFFAEFHPQQGPLVSFEIPEGFILSSALNRETKTKQFALDFDSISEYIIPKPNLCNQLLIFSTTSYKVLGFPVSIEDPKYPRNELKFNLCFVFSQSSDTSAFNQVVRKLARVLRSLEVECEYIFNAEKKNGVLVIMEQLFEGLNQYGECEIPINDANRINVKLLPTYPEPPKVYDYQVPICILNVENAVNKQWDLTLQKVVPLINGVNSIKRIAESADVDINLVRLAIQHLWCFGCVRLIDIFQYSNIYALKKNVKELLKSPERQLECIQFVSRPDDKPPTFATIFSIYCQLEHGKTVKEWFESQEVYKLNIDVRRLLIFGVLNNFMYRVYKYPILLTLFSNETETDNIPSNLKSMLNGEHHYDEICTEFSKSPAEIDEMLNTPNSTQPFHNFLVSTENQIPYTTEAPPSTTTEMPSDRTPTLPQPDSISLLSQFCAKYNVSYTVTSTLTSSKTHTSTVKIGKELICPSKKLTFTTPSAARQSSCAVALEILESDAQYYEHDKVHQFLKICAERDDVVEFRTKYDWNSVGDKRVYIEINGDYFGGESWFKNFAKARMDAVEKAFAAVKGDVVEKRTGMEIVRGTGSNQFISREKQIPFQNYWSTIKSDAVQHTDALLKLQDFCMQNGLKCHLPIIQQSAKGYQVGIRVGNEVFGHQPDKWFETSKESEELTAAFALQVLQDDAASSLDDVVHVFSYFCHAKKWTVSTKILSDTPTGKGVVVSINQKFVAFADYTTYAMARKDAIAQALQQLDIQVYYQRLFFSKIKRPFKQHTFPLKLEILQTHSTQTTDPTTITDQQSYYKSTIHRFLKILQIPFTFSYAIHDDEKFCCAVHLKFPNHQPSETTIYGHLLFDSMQNAAESVSSHIYHALVHAPLKSVVKCLSGLGKVNSDEVWKRCKIIFGSERGGRDLGCGANAQVVDVNYGNNKRKFSDYQVEDEINSQSHVVSKKRVEVERNELNWTARNSAEMNFASVSASTSSTTSMEIDNSKSSRIGTRSMTPEPELENVLALLLKQKTSRTGEILDDWNFSNRISAETRKLKSVNKTISSSDSNATLIVPVDAGTVPVLTDSNASTVKINGIGETANRKQSPQPDNGKHPSEPKIPATNNDTTFSKSSPKPLLTSNHIPDTTKFPLHHACAIGDLETLLKLANPTTIQQPDVKNRLPLHYFCENRAMQSHHTEQVEDIIWKLSGYTSPITMPTREILSKQDVNYLTPLAISLAVDARVSLDMKRKRSTGGFVVPDFKDSKPKIYVSLATQVLLDICGTLNVLYPGSHRSCWHGLVLELGKRLDGGFEDVLEMGSELVFVMVTWAVHDLDLFLRDSNGETGWDVLNGIMKVGNRGERFRVVCKSVKEVQDWAVSKKKN